MKRLKILFHSVNGIGLGHLNRTSTIAKELRNKADILFEIASVEFFAGAAVT